MAASNIFFNFANLLITWLNNEFLENSKIDWGGGHWGLVWEEPSGVLVRLGGLRELIDWLWNRKSIYFFILILLDNCWSGSWSDGGPITNKRSHLGG